MGSVVDDNVEKASANARQKIVAKKTRAAPNEFDFAAKHPEHEHVEEDVPDVCDFMEKEIGKGLPDAKAGKNSGRDKAETHDKQVVTRNSAVVINECFEDEDDEVGDQEEFHARSD